jgi:Kyakuja-Dileera-Zisupton transposase
MDYLFWKSLQDSEILMVVVSYDIACQWSKYLRERMDKLDHYFRIFDGRVHIVYLVPKFHLPAHITACRNTFSFNFTKGVGRTDGEAPERGWAEVNPLAPSTKEMGPGSRRDTLDAHFGDYNWRKVVGMGAFRISNGCFSE